MFEEFVESIDCHNIIVIHERDSVGLALFFRQKCETEGKYCECLCEDELDEFERVKGIAQCIVAFSKYGGNDNLRRMIITARRMGVQVYGVCTDFRSGLVLLCDEPCIISEPYYDFLNIGVLPIDHSFKPKVRFKRRNCTPNIFVPYDGMVVRVNVARGDEVEKGDVLGVIEFMKMESEIISDRKGKVSKVFAVPGSDVLKGDPFMSIESEF